MKLVIWILFVHFVADFIAQSDAMARAKSKSWLALSRHIGAYGAVLFCGLYFCGPGAWLYALANSVAHFFTDAVTSRASSRLWAAGRVHEFFVVIGADQFIHAATLILTIPLLWWKP